MKLNLLTKISCFYASSLKAFFLFFLLLIGNVASGQTLTIVPNSATTGSSGTGYVTTAKAFTASGVDWSINNWIPNTIQVRGNQSAVASNFQFSNTSAIPGSITKVTITRNAGTLVASNAFLLLGTSEQTGASSGTAGTMSGNNIVWTPTGSSNTFFKIYFTNGATSGTTTITNIIVEYSAGKTVTFNPNGGSGTMGSQTASVPTNLTSNTFTRTGYSFTGWNTTTSGSGTAYANGAQYSFSADMTLYAQWSVNSYNVTYNANASTSGTVPAAQSGNYNSSINLSSNTGALAKTGYVFNGWNTNASGTGTHYNENANFTIPAGNTALYAEWKLIASYSGVSAGAGTEPATLSSLINTQTDSLLNFDFTVTDDNNTTDGNDSLPTLISQIVIPQNTGNDIANWTQAIDGAVLTDGVNMIVGTVNATNITFSGIPATVNSLGYIADDGNKTYSLNIWLKTSLGGTLPTTIDGQNLVFKVDRSNFTTAGSATSTQFEAGTGTVVGSGAGNNAVEVIATKLDFVQQPTNITVNSNMSPGVTVSANDAYGNRDRDYTTAVAVTSTGNLTGAPVSSNAVSGLATFSTLRHTAAGTNLKLTAASSSFASIESDPFSVALVTQASDYFKSKEVTGTWATASNWLSSPDNVTWINSTLVPSNTASGITISDNSTITVSATATGKDITVESGGVLTVNSAFTISGTNVVNGTWNQITTTAISNSGTLVFGDDSIYNHNANGGTIPTATWSDSSNCNVIGYTGTSNINGVSGIGQDFGNLTFNNTKTGYLNLFAAAGTMTVRGTLTVGPLTSNLVSFGNSSFSVTANINKINVTGGALHGVGSGTVLNLNVTTDLVVDDTGAFRLATGNGNANVTVTNDVLLKGQGSLEVVAGTSSTVGTQILSVGRDFVIAGTSAILNLKSNTGGATGPGVVNVGRNFSSNNTATDAIDVDFGIGSVSSNYIAISGNLTHTGNGVYQTTSTSQARGFVFRGTSSMPSQISYSGENSDYTSYEVDAGYYAKLNTDLTLGSNTGPVSYFTVKGTLDFDDKSIIGNNVARFVTANGSVLSTSNAHGFGGTNTTGSLRSFGATGSTSNNGTAQFIAGANYLFNTNTITPFPTGTIGNPASLTFNNAEVVSNRTGSLIVSGAVNINGTSKFSLNSAGNSLALGGVMTIGENAAFDNNGENQITSGGSGAAIVINGTFVTKDAQGFTGSNSSVPTVPVTINAGATVHYALDGTQTVSSRADYQNLLFTGSGTKSTTGSIAAIAGTVTIDGSNTILDVSNNTFGNSTTGLTMVAGTFRLAGSGVKPDISGSYNLASGTNIEFTGTSATQIRLAPQYANVIISGSNVVAGTTTNGGLTFQENGNFIVKNGARFKVNNDNGFSGASTTAIKNTNNPTITLESGSSIDYTGADQIVTNSLDYHNLIISTDGVKTAAPGNIIVNGLTTVSAGSLIISETADHTTSNVLYAHKGISNYGGALNFGTNAQLMQDSDAVNIGDIVSARKGRLPKMGYNYWSSPVNAQNLYAFSNGGQVGGTPKNRFWVYDEATDTFKNTGAFLLNDSSVFETGRGYAIRGMDNFSTSMPTVSYGFAFTGVPNNGELSFASLKYTNDMKGYNLVGNPYPSNIDFDKLYAANSSKIYATAYFWTNNDMTVTQQQGAGYSGNNYAVYNLTGGSPAVQIDGDLNQSGSADLAPSNIIKVGQGFIIKTKLAGKDQPLDFTNDMRSTDDGNFFNNKNNINNDRFWLKLISPSSVSNTVLVGYIPSATNDFEIDYDGELFVIGSDSFYSLLGSRKLAIQGRSAFDREDKVALGNVYSQNGTYRISIADKQGVFDNGQKIYLKDKLLNKVIDLTNGDYTFQAIKGTDHTRFEIVYKAEEVLGVGADLKSDFMVYKDNNEQVIKSTKKLGKVEIYDASGKLVKTAIVNGTEARFDTTILSNGVYILKIENSGDLKTKKFIK
ncbi:MAG: T9SS type A sorting domain-containing protein [Chryseobacterium sp.]|nr:T9SS type A sorting domain-containing protein [Chryseobacterium sp.]